MQNNTVFVKTEFLKPNPENFFRRLEGEEYEDFKSSVREFGVLEPILIDENGVILGGEQRWRAAIDLKIDQVPVRVISDPDEKKKLRILIHSNVRQRHLTPFEVLSALRRELEVTGSMENVAKNVGLSKRSAYRYLPFDTLYPGLKALVNTGKVPLSVVEQRNKKACTRP